MPFVKKTGSKAVQRPTDARKIFIGRTTELKFFTEEILRPEDPAYNILSISGQGGVGKSTLLLRFIDDTHSPEFKHYCLTQTRYRSELQCSVIVNERRVSFFAKGKSKEPRRGSKRLQLIEKEERDSCPNAKRCHVVHSARSLLKGQVTSREMMHHL